MLTKVVVIGGGTGNYSLLSGLKLYKPLELTAIVSMMDDGGSTGILRNEFGILPPGDIRRCMVALSEESELIRQLFEHRFQGSLGDHSFGNLFHLALSQITGSEEAAIFEMSRILKISGRVLPITLENARLKAELENGTIVSGETNIDLPKHDGDLRIKRLFSDSDVKVNPKAIRAIEEAEFIIISPGDLYTSTLPNFIVRKVPEAIRSSAAVKIYVCNLMTKHGETSGFDATDHVRVIHQYLGAPCLDIVVVNSRAPDPQRVAEYEAEKSFPVNYSVDSLKAEGVREVIEADVTSSSTLIRHDPMRVSWQLIKIIQERRTLMSSVPPPYAPR